MRRLRSIPLLALAALLNGCGSGLTLSTGGGPATGSRANPVVGWYTGRLYDYGADARLAFRIYSNGNASGTVRVGNSTVATVSGTLEPDRELVLTSGSLVIDGEFRGAYHPLDNRYYTTQGVRFVGTWERGGSSDEDGGVEAWHEDWPPPLPTNSYDDDYWYYPSIPGGGGSTTDPSWDDDGPSNGGGGSTDPGDPPLDSGGDPTDDGIVLRRAQE